MSIKRVTNAANPVTAIDPKDLPQDGSAVTYESTFRRRVNDGTGANMTVDDYEQSEWEVERQTSSGWATVDIVKKRPYKSHLRKAYGEGKYRIRPLDHGGKPLDQFAAIELIGSPTMTTPKPEVSEKPGREKEPSNELPSWMRLIMAQQSQERQDAIRRAEESERRREEWERKQAAREWEKAEREERERRSREEREAEERRMAQERQNQLILAGLGIAKEFATSRNQPAPASSSLNEAMLAAIIREREVPKPTGGIKDTLDLLVVLDQIAESRAERNAPPPPEKEEETDLGKTLMNMLPSIMAARSGMSLPATQAAPAIDPNMIQQLAGSAVDRVLSDPNAIAQFVAKDPKKTIKTFIQAIESDPNLKAEVEKALTEDEE